MTLGAIYSLQEYISVGVVIPQINSLFRFNLHSISTSFVGCYWSKKLMSRSYLRRIGPFWAGSSWACLARWFIWAWKNCMGQDPSWAAKTANSHWQSYISIPIFRRQHWKHDEAYLFGKFFFLFVNSPLIILMLLSFNNWFCFSDPWIPILS